MTASTFLTVTGDLVTQEHDAALRAARHICAAVSELIDDQDTAGDRSLDLLTDLLGGPHWYDQANELLDELAAN